MLSLQRRMSARRTSAKPLRVARALLALALLGSCGGAGSGAVLVIDTQLCELGDPGESPTEWSQIVVTIDEDQTFCAVLDAENAPEGCVEIGQGSFPLTLPIESASGEAMVPVQIELFANVGDTSPVICETSTINIVPESVTWAYTVVQRSCGGGGECVPGVLTPMPTWSSLNDVIADLTMTLGTGVPSVTCRPPDPAPEPPIRRVATGNEHACLVDMNARLFCWGRNDKFQLGLSARDQTRPRLVDLGAGAAVRDVSLGRAHSCAVVEDPSAKVLCWGLNDQHQLGRGGSVGNGEGSFQILEVGNSDGAVQISAGQDHTCLLTGDGTVRCWGLNDAGQVTGTPGDPVEQATPVTLPLPALQVSVNGRAGSGHHSCALLMDGTVSCWGEGEQGQLGHPDGPSPGIVTGAATGMVQVASGGLDTCGADGMGQLICWGRNQFPGTLGIETSGQTTVQMATPAETTLRVRAPEAATSGPDLATLSSGDQFRCFIESASAQPYCLGLDEGSGRLGVPGVSETFMPMPVDLPAGLASNTFSQIATGDRFACALPSSSDNMPICWGSNSRGQRATGNTIDASDPNQIEICD